MNYSLLDKFFRWLRFRKIITYIPNNSIVCDLGCRPNAYFLKQIYSFIKYGVGLDKEVKERRESKLELKKVNISKNIPLKNKSFDVVTMIAFLEHLEYPQEVLKEVFRILRNKGKLILISPTPLAKPVLEILAYKLQLINKDDIQDHKNYFWSREIKKMLLKSGFREKNIKNYFFEIGLNNLIIAKKDE